MKSSFIVSTFIFAVSLIPHQARASGGSQYEGTRFCATSWKNIDSKSWNYDDLIQDGAGNDSFDLRGELQINYRTESEKGEKKYQRILIPSQIHISRVGTFIGTRHSAGTDVNCLFTVSLRFAEDNQVNDLFDNYEGISAGISAVANVGFKVLKNSKGIYIFASDRLFTTSTGTIHSLSPGLGGSAIDGSSITMPEGKNWRIEGAANEWTIFATSTEIKYQVIETYFNWDQIKSGSYAKLEKAGSLNDLKHLKINDIGNLDVFNHLSPAPL